MYSSLLSDKNQCSLQGPGLFNCSFLCSGKVVQGKQNPGQRQMCSANVSVGLIARSDPARSLAAFN